MKNQLFTIRVWRLALIIFSLAVTFAMIRPNNVLAQVKTTTYSGVVYVYQTEDDTLSVIASGGVIKFFEMNSAGNMVLKATATVDANGQYIATVTSSQDLYVVVFPEDIDDNFVASYYPGWLDFESAETLPNTGGVVDYDWGAVGKEIVERPSTGTFNVEGKISMENLSDALPMVYAFQGDMPVKSAMVNPNGTYNLSLSNGEYEIFVSAPGYESQSKFVNSDATKNVNLNFALDTYRGESSTNNVSVADNYIVSQNYPNPFNPTTNIKYSMPAAGLVKLTVYNMLGKEVASLINRYQEAGSYSVEFNGSNLASGVYIYSLTVGNQTVTKKMNLIK